MPEAHHCPSCGAPLAIRNRFVTVVTCEFCGGVALYDGAHLDPTGRTAGLATIPSPLYLDATGRIEGQAFRVLGRLVYEYDGEVWTEWFVETETDGRWWLVEDEGAFSLVRQQDGIETPPFESVNPGDTIRTGELEVFVDEVGEATIVGAEGQLGAAILPGEAIRYVDGSMGQAEVSIEYGERAVEVFVGRAVPRESLVIDDEAY